MIGTLLLAAAPLAAGAPEDSLAVLFWNVENFFDYRNDSTGVSDAEFSSLGKRRWNRKRFEAKCQGVAKTLLFSERSLGRMPDVVGFAEVENGFVLRRLLGGTILRKLDYSYIHFDSPDRRGIDLALLYRKSLLEKVSAKPCHIYDDSLRVLPTRDILLCRFRLKSRPEAEFAVLVNHHPSKFGGAAASFPRRAAALRRLRFLCDSLRESGVERILAVGDFNDTPESPLYRQLEPTLLPLYDHLKGEGTIRYEGQWELIDLAFASPDASGGPPAWASPQHILRPPFLLTRDKTHGGWKPLRTYVGPRYNGGLSDHCPIWVKICVPKESEAVF